MNISRRGFLGGAAGFGAFAGMRVFADELGLNRGPGAKLKVGIVSDIHILKADCMEQLAGDTRFFEKALLYFRDRGADAVMICGDMADKGLVDQLVLVGEAWDRVFPKSKAPDGRHVEKLFVYGNHDLEGQKYGPFAKKLYPDPEELKKHLIVTDRAAAWERAFHEKYEDIYLKEINGYQFVGGQWNTWGGDPKLVKWVEANKAKLNPKLPLLFAQHPHPKDTCYGPWAWGHDGGHVTTAFKDFPNLIAFSGHSHYSLTDERAIWQGAYTSIGAGSLRYPGSPAKYFKSIEMPVMGAVRDETAKMVRDGIFMSIYDDRVVFERRDFTNDAPLGPDWVMPLPVADPKPFAFATRAKEAKIPAFAAGAVATATLTEEKSKKKKKGEKGRQIVQVEFPSAPVATRAFVYTVTVVDAEGKDGRVNAFIPIDYARAPSALEPKLTCTFDLRELPSDATVRFAVRPMESFGATGAPIVSNEVKLPVLPPPPPKEEKPAEKKPAAV